MSETATETVSKEAGGSAPAFYTNPFVEQAAFTEGFGLAVFGQIGVLQLSGPDRFKFLNSLSSQRFPFPDGSSCEALFLDGQGRIKWSIGVIGTGAPTSSDNDRDDEIGSTNSDNDDEAVSWLLCEPTVAQELCEYLLSMRFMLQVEVQDVSANYAAFACTKSRVSLNQYVKSDQVLTWIDPWPGPVSGAAQYFQGAHPGNLLPTTYYLVPTSQEVDFTEFWLEAANRELSSGDFETSEALRVGTLAFTACRLAAWRPLWASEVDAKAIPNELDWLRTAASPEKGCYPGQETVARIINLGKPPRRLTFLQVDGSAGEMPNPGDPLVLVEGSRPVGQVTAVANHFEMGPIALGLVRTSTDPNAVLLVEVGGETGSVVRGLDTKNTNATIARKTVAVSQEIIVPVDGKSDLSPVERPGAGLLRGQGSRRPGLMGKGF